MLAGAREMGGIWEAFTSLICLTGVRMSEARKARWHQFELRGDDACWYVEGKGSRRRGAKIRRVPLVPALVDALGRWRVECDSPEWLFPSMLSATGYVSSSYLNKVLTEVCETAAIDRATAHQWRHTVATIVVERTDNLLAAQQLLGHSNLSTTQIYTKLSLGKVRLAVDALELPGPDAA